MVTMLNHLKLRLTLIFLFASILLVGLVGISSYTLLNYYFMESNDAALKYKMAVTFASVGIPLPKELETSLLEWHGHNEAVENETHESTKTADEEEHTEALAILASGLPYEGELSSIFIFPLDEKSNLVINPNPFKPPMDPDPVAASVALTKGSDIRTIQLKDGVPIRLLSYATPRETGFSVLQMGKPISDQHYLLDQFMAGLATYSGLIIVLLGLVSWWMAGRSLRPSIQAWEMQQTFIANASHELRTPLTLIRASAEVVSRQTNPQGKQMLLNDIMTECDHMSQIVEDLLLISKMDTHQLKLDIILVDIKDLLEDVQRQFEPLARKNHVELKIEEQQGKVKGDRMRLRQILIILLDNALRFTSSGGSIVLSSRQVSRNIELCVQDDGKGIPPEHLEHVFERFYQVNPGKDEKNRGNGLGLSIAKSLVEAHEGTIKIISEPGKGTSVTIILPASR
jgi:signal transduction histidine kinase